MRGFSNFFIISCLFLLPSCISQTSPPLQASLLLYRFDPPAFIEYNADLQIVKEIRFATPPNCGLYDTFPAPLGPVLLVELTCPNGPMVLFFDTKTGSATQPVTGSDSHFLAWTSDGSAAYLKVDSLGNAHIIRAFTDGSQKGIPITEFTYDLASKPNSNDFTFTFSRGLGQGSEIWLARLDGKVVEQLSADPLHYLSFARWSPDGGQIAFIKIPDTQTPFTVGELWVIDADGANARKLAEADAGHGYAANWSPDGTRLAFVVRENPGDETADQSSEALLSNVYIVEVESGALTQVTYLTEGRAETPYWSPDGNTLGFNVVMNGRMTVSIADVSAVVGSSDPLPAEIQPLVAVPACCPAWMRK